MAEEKHSYTLREVTRIFGISEQTVFRIEAEGLVQASEDEKSGKSFTPSDLERIRMILDLARELGVNWAGIEVILHMREQMLLMQRQVQDILNFLHREMKDTLAERQFERQSRSLPKMDLIRILEERESESGSE